ncbi:MAG: cytochrome d ubiquinol oxidase subunit II [Sneathiella sp.]|nr:cytochrome d ubiquinol oxidase subunit II [Sneathiella sp.]
MEFDVAFIWALLIAVAVLAYVILDGFDLGIGMLFPFLGSEANRARAMNTVAPVWDGNETWLILGGGGLFAVFPLAYAVIMPALYMPVMLMLFGLVFRGVAFEFRWRTVRWQKAWDASFFGGSLVAAFSQGIMLGALIQGIEVANRQYAGGWWDWLTPFSVLTGGALVIGYVLLGATWLVLKTDGELQNRAYGYSAVFTVLTLVMVGLVSLWTPFLDERFAVRWFSYPSILYTSIVPVLLVAVFVGLYVSLRRRQDKWPFPLAISIFLISYVGLAISIFPMMVPPSITIWQAAGPEDSLIFLLVGALILLPIILAYTAYSYWVFRGKVREGEGYH